MAEAYKKAVGKKKAVPTKVKEKVDNTTILKFLNGIPGEYVSKSELNDLAEGKVNPDRVKKKTILKYFNGLPKQNKDFYDALKKAWVPLKKQEKEAKGL
ncbi:hypothetical protein JXB01_02930 [Candidatus Micrarchaeota archaeon]|nr:hypothetical protein [Candidatus Micrarchaeota archaeon]